MQVIRKQSDNTYILIKEFKGSRFKNLVAMVNVEKKRVLFQFENDMEVNTFTIYSDIPKLVGSYGFGSDYSLNKRQCLWLRNNRLKLLSMKDQLISEALK